MNTKYAGMTVNERLFEADLMADFDRAARNGDKNKMVEILIKVELSLAQAQETSDAIVKNPKMYGY
jgi:hypothetical protein